MTHVAPEWAPRTGLGSGEGTSNSPGAARRPVGVNGYSEVTWEEEGVVGAASGWADGLIVVTCVPHEAFPNKGNLLNTRLIVRASNVKLGFFHECGANNFLP